MNRLLFNRSVLNSNFLARNYGVKPLTPPSPLLLKNITKEPSRFVYKPIIYTFSTNCLKNICRSNASYAPINIDPSKLVKDVIVFKYENPRYFKMMNIFGIAQFFFWLICSEFTLSNLRYTPVNEGAPNFADLPLYLRVNLGENKYKYGLAIGCFSFGLLILGFVWTFTLRNVRYLILRKGGQKVAFVTYGPFGTNRILDVPLNCVSAVTARESGSNSLPIKVKHRKFHYLLDKQGEFTNPNLFDHVINVKRRI